MDRGTTAAINILLHGDSATAEKPAKESSQYSSVENKILRCAQNDILVTMENEDELAPLHGWGQAPPLQTGGSHMENEDNLATDGDKLTSLQQLLQVTFHDRSLLQRAVTHHSCCPETAIRDSYDTLEFLGDALLGAHVVEYIFRTYPDKSEGEMTNLKSEVVSRRVLARIGQELGLFPFICVDLANLRTFNDRSRDSLCADVLEAIVGAIHIDQGHTVTHDFVARHILPEISRLDQQSIDTNPKGRLQKELLRRSRSLPRYRVLERGGANNDRVFTVGVYVHDIVLGVGKGSSIKEAGRQAARQALEYLSENEIP